MICRRLEEVFLEASSGCIKSLIYDDKVNFFNVNRCKLLDGTIRALSHKSFEESERISVKFSDGVGQNEGAIDAGGPTREFLRLALACILDSSIFGGEETSKYLEKCASGIYNLNEI